MRVCDLIEILSKLPYLATLDFGSLDIDNVDITQITMCDDIYVLFRPSVIPDEVIENEI